MTQEDKQLLLIDLCGRLPYGVKVENTSYSEPQVHTLFGKVSDDLFLMLETYKSVGGEDYRRVTDDVHYTGFLETIKPYLRPMSSMTEEEEDEVSSLIDDREEPNFVFRWDEIQNLIGGASLCIDDFYKVIDWLNAHHFDYRGLIEKGLAIEAPANMYKTK